MNQSPNRPDPVANSDSVTELGVTLRRLLSGSIFVFFGLLLRTALLLLFELLAARHLGPASYGLFSLAFTIVVLASSIPVLGLQNSLRRFISFNLETRKLDEANGLALFGLVWPTISGVALAIVLFLSAETVSVGLFGKPDLAPLIKAMAFIVPLWSTRRLATIVFSGLKTTLFKVILEDLTEPGLRVLVAAIALFSAWSAAELAHGTLVAYLLVGGMAWILVLRAKRKAVGSTAGVRLPWGELLVFSGPLVISELAELILSWINLLLIGALSVDYEVGLFRAASQPPMLASAILTSFAFIYLPTATELFARNDFWAWRRANNAVAIWTLTFAFPIGAVCLVFPDTLITIIFGEAYRDSVLPMQLLSAAYLFHAGCGFTGMNLVVAGYTRVQMVGALLGLASNIAISIALIPSYGATGAAAAILLSTVFRNCYNLFWMWRLLKILPFTAKYLGVLGVHLSSTVLLAIAAHTLNVHPVISLLAMGILEIPLAIGMGWLIGVIDLNDLTRFIRIRQLGQRKNVR